MPRHHSALTGRTQQPAGMFRMFHMIRMIYMPGRSGRSSRPIQSNPSGMVRLLLMALVACIVCPAFLFGCSRSTYIAERATRAYPAHLHNTRTLDVQVFREGTDIRIVNTSPISFASFDLWLNKRYVRHIDALPAGETIVLSLWDFYDHRGEVFNAGGFFASYDPTPLRMTQIQLDDETPMIGLVTIRSEPADG